MNNENKYDSETAYSFAQLIAKKKNEYFMAEKIEEKEQIMENFICDKEISDKFLTSLIDNYNKENYSKKVVFQTIHSYYNVLVYSLDKTQNSKYYSLLNKLFDGSLNNMEKFIFLAKNDPIDNFKDITYDFKDLNVLNDDYLNNKENIINNIDSNILKMANNVYDVDLGNYYIPPLKEYPIYTYNFYSYQMFRIIKKFQLKRATPLFNNNKKKFVEYKNIDEKWELYKTLMNFFEDVKPLFVNLNYDNIENDIKILKIVIFYLQIFEHTRNYFNIRENFLGIIQSLGSTPITNEILEKYTIYKINSNVPIKKEEWDSIGINEEITIKGDYSINAKIKQFNDKILKYKGFSFFTKLVSPKIKYLNIDGLSNQAIIKSNSKIENYCINLLKHIFSSQKYINNFIKHNNRFNSINVDKKQKILESMFRGPNKDKIFEEIWDNIFFIPFPVGLSGFNNRNQYAIFVNSEENNKKKYSPKTIIPRIHSEINTLIHEFSHNLVLLLAANLNEGNFETNLISVDQEIIDVQKLYKDLYSQNLVIFNEFSDFGDLMEVELYGIKPRKFKTFSGLFCLNSTSYELKNEEFREVCANLYNYKGPLTENINNIINSDKDIENLNKIYNKDNDKINLLLIQLLKSDFTEILGESFPITDCLNNEDCYEEGNSRGHFNELLFSNEEFSIERDYDDKLDKL